MIKRICSVALLMLATAWLSGSPAWNSLMAFAVALVGYITVEAVQHHEEVKKGQDRGDIASKIREIKNLPVELPVVDDEQELKHRQMIADADLNLKRMARSMQLGIARLFLPPDYEEKHGIKRAQPVATDNAGKVSLQDTSSESRRV